MRCPSCAKLYQIDVSTIFSTTPHFQCLTCSVQFEFDFPPASGDIIKARRVSETQGTGVAPAEATRRCPKCGAPSPKAAKECNACQVVFEKVERLPNGTLLKTKPSLVSLWKDLLENYTEEDRHQAFLMACKESEALEFAQMKYKEIRTAQGQDEIAQQMLARIEALRTVMTIPSASGADNRAGPTANRPKWLRIAIVAPFAISFVLICWGLMHAGPRNMVGAGIAISLLSYGLITGFWGRSVLLESLNPSNWF